MGSRRKTVFRTAFEIYTTRGERGSGPCGTVFEAEDSSGQSRAVKLLDAGRTGPSALGRAARELRFCSGTPHKNIAPVVDSGLHGTKGAFYVMPLYESSLREAIRDGIPQENILPLFGKILDGVEAAHLFEMWHGDLKPENILLNPDNQQTVVADFGMAHFLHEERTLPPEHDGEGHNSFPYAAPELRQKPVQIGGSADVYALGVLLREMFTGSALPGPGELDITDVAPDYAYLDWTVKRMTHHEPLKRPTVAEVKKELIARGNEFLCLQKLNALKNKVLFETEVDDPLLRDPIAIHSADFRAETLYITFNQVPPPDWISAFHSSGRPSTLTGHGPERLVFMGRLAHLRVARGTEPQELLDQAKGYVAAANHAYAEWAKSNHLAHLEREREQKRTQIAVEERRHQVLSRLRL